MNDMLAAWQSLMRRLEDLQSSGTAAEISELQSIAEACQNFLDVGQKFDDLAENASLEAPSLPPGITPAHLSDLKEALSRSIETIVLAREGVQDELRALQHTARGLRGYKWLQPIYQERYLSKRR